MNVKRSPSGQWRLEWDDPSVAGDGHRRSLPARTRILRDRRLVRLIAEAERPQDGIITDAGLAIVVDWQHDTPKRPTLHSAVIVAFSDGRTRVHEFGASAGKLTVQRTQGRVVVTFGHTPTDDQVSRVEFDLSTGEPVTTVMNVPRVSPDPGEALPPKNPS